MRIVDRRRSSRRLQQQRQVLIMAGVFPVDEKTVTGNGENERPHDPEGPSGHALAIEHHPDSRHLRCDCTAPSDWTESCQSLVGFVFLESPFKPNPLNDGANSIDDQFWLVELNKMSTLFGDKMGTVW
jgi:hypothetical protein